MVLVWVYIRDMTSCGTPGSLRWIHVVYIKGCIRPDKRKEKTEVEKGHATRERKGKAEGSQSEMRQTGRAHTFRPGADA
jgi:hypothetical protein